jgi:predicted GNAT family acetyltransferase
VSLPGADDLKSIATDERFNLSCCMNIEHKQTATKGFFLIFESGEKLAEMAYSKAGDQTMIIEHTEVSDKLRGKGAGKQLVAAAVDFAKKNNKLIMPLCPFAKSVFDKVQEFSDVLK